MLFTRRNQCKYTMYIFKNLNFKKFQPKKVEIKISKLLISDNSLIYVLAYLNKFENEQQIKNIKKIFKTLIGSGKLQNEDNFVIKKYFSEYSNIIANLLIDLLQDDCVDENIIFKIGKMIRYLIEFPESLIKMLNFEFFSKVYNLTKSDKFVYSSEAFKILCV